MGIGIRVNVDEKNNIFLWGICRFGSPTGGQSGAERRNYGINVAHQAQVLAAQPAAPQTQAV